MTSTEMPLTPEQVDALKSIFRPVTLLMVEDFMDEGLTYEQAWEQMLAVKPADVNDQQEEIMTELFREAWTTLEA